MGRQRGGMCSPEPTGSHSAPTPQPPPPHLRVIPWPQASCPQGKGHEPELSPCREAAAPLALPEPVSSTTVPKGHWCKNKSSTAALSPPQRAHRDPARNTDPEPSGRMAAHTGAHTRVQRAEETVQGWDAEVPRLREGSTPLTGTAFPGLWWEAISHAFHGMGKF